MRPHRTGSEGRPWVQLHHPKPPRVEDEMRYWGDQPPEPSPRCVYWVSQIERGWLPNRRIGMEGYHTSALWYGVYIWEYLNVLSPMISMKRQQEQAA